MRSRSVSTRSSPRSSAPPAPQQSPTGRRVNYSATTVRNTVSTMPRPSLLDELHNAVTSPTDAALVTGDRFLMRPVRLDMDGFASFRDKTILDFTDADYFVLVGATGSGKSTVIDALIFALYGTVPRWNDQRMITPALAPTATRCVVRLVFDADGQRYVVAREARRSGGKTSRVSMHASRLERLHDPDDLDGDGDVLAADPK